MHTKAISKEWSMKRKNERNLRFSMLQLYGFIKRLTDCVMILVLAYTSVDCRNNLAEEKSILDNSIKKTLEAIINVFFFHF